MPTATAQRMRGSFGRVFHTWRSTNVLERETCGHQRDTKYRSPEIDVVRNAAGLSPPERRKDRKRFENVGKGHDYEAGDAEEL